MSPRAAKAAPATAPASRRWLFGPFPDLAFGCGLAYAVVFVVLASGGSDVRAMLPAGLALLPLNMISSAHYGATALRAYEQAADRRAYAVFTLWTTILLGAAFVAGLASVTFGSWVITLYLTWSPWHYAGQNFGVAMTFLRRREVDVTRMARRFLHGSFALSWILALLALHFTAQRVSYAPDQLESGVFAFYPLADVFGIPDSVGDALMIGVGAAYVVCTAGAVVLLRSRASWRDLGPALLLIGTQALWFSVPVAARHWKVLTDLEPLSTEQAAYAFMWVGLGHAVQYLWITSYFARKADPSRGIPSFLLRSLLAGAALWVVPAMLFAPSLLGRLPYDAGLAAMVASLVNLHHFVLDGAIWKLRNARVAGVLVRSEADGARDAPMKPAWRAALWLGGFAVIALANAQTFLIVYGFNRPFERGDLDAARAADETLDSLGWTSAERPLRLGHGYLIAGEFEQARRSFEKSVASRETAWAWVGLGELHHRQGERAEAGDAYARALKLEPNHPAALFYAGVLALEQGQHERGRRSIAKARESAVADKTTTPQLRAEIERVLSELQ